MDTPSEVVYAPPGATDTSDYPLRKQLREVLRLIVLGRLAAFMDPTP